MDHTHKELLEWLNKVEDNLNRLRPKSISSTSNLMNEYIPLELTSAEELLKNVSFNLTIDNKRTQLLKAFEPVVSKINLLYDEIKNASESDYKEAYQNWLNVLIERKIDPKLIDPMKTQGYLDDWELPTKQTGLLLGKAGTFQTIEIFRDQAMLAVELINKYLPISELQSNIEDEELHQNSSMKEGINNPYSHVFTNKGYPIFEKYVSQFLEESDSPTEWCSLFFAMEDKKVLLRNCCKLTEYKNIIPEYTSNRVFFKKPKYRNEISRDTYNDVWNKLGSIEKIIFRENKS